MLPAGRGSLGSGLPTNQNVHEVAQLVNPDARVVYADIDPVVVSHAQALLSGQQVAASGATSAARMASSVLPRYGS